MGISFHGRGDGKNKAAFWSGFAQRTIFDKGHINRPWFSHVAVVMDDRFAYEASPHRFDTWSGSELPLGVRPVLIIDLLVDAKDFVILRKPDAPETTGDAFKISAPHIAGLYSATYSIFSLKKDAEEIVPFLVNVPDRPFMARTKPSEIAQLLLIVPASGKISKRTCRPKLPQR